VVLCVNALIIQSKQPEVVAKCQFYSVVPVVLGSPVPDIDELLDTFDDCSQPVYAKERYSNLLQKN
jgi:hypothetical protein